MLSLEGEAQEAGTTKARQQHSEIKFKVPEEKQSFYYFINTYGVTVRLQHLFLLQNFIF